MAKVNKPYKMNSLKKKYIREVLIAIVLSFAMLAFAVMFALEKSYIQAVVAIVFLLVLLKSSASRLNALQGGIRGENSSLSILKQLKGNYTIFSDLVIKSRGKTAQVDHIIIASNRIWILEVKNISGVLTGGMHDKTLTQKKRDGEIKTPYNPLLQVQTHKKILDEYLREHSVQCEVKAAVCFVNKNLTNKVNWGQNDVFFYGEEQKLLSQLSYGNTKKTEAIKRAETLIKKL